MSVLGTKPGPLLDEYICLAAINNSGYEELNEARLNGQSKNLIQVNVGCSD